MNKNKLDKALKLLNYLIKKGTEYPDAHFEVVWNLALTRKEADKLQEAYDSQDCDDWPDL